MSRHAKAGNKELRQLATKLKAHGLILERDRRASKHHLVWKASGEALRYDDGRPVVFPSTPSPSSVRTLTQRIQKLLEAHDD